MIRYTWVLASATFLSGAQSTLAQQEPVLPEVKVEAQPEQETAADPVDGYVAGRGVTGTKTDTPLIETPQSISVITSDRLDAQDANSLSEALRYTPGIQAEPFGFEPRFTLFSMRGFDATTTGLYRDGLQLRNPGFAGSYSLEPYGAERIEVPRGPASVLYGQGSPGGLVNFVSKRPTAKPFGEVDLEGGNFDRLQGAFDLGGPITKDGAFLYRLTGLARDSDTQVDFVKDDRVFIAPAFTWRPSDATTLTLLSEYKRDETRSSQALPAAGTLFDNPNGSIPTRRFTGEPDVDRYEREDFSIAYLFKHRANEAWTFRQNARYYANDLDDVSVFSSGFQADQRTLDRSVFENFGELDGFAIDNQAQVELATGAVGHALLMGLEYQHIDVSSEQSFGTAPSIDVFDPVYGAPVPTPPVFKDSDTDQQQIGLYVQDQIKFYEKFVVLLGGRYDWAEAETENNLANTTTDQDDNQFTGRAGLLYLFDNGLAPYASYSESFLPAVGTDASGRPFEPETGRQYEVGLKYQPPGANSVVTLALFDLTRENFVQFDPATFLQVQTGEVRSRGIELEGVASFDFGLDLIASYTYLDIEITESSNPAEVGQRPMQTAEHTGSLWANYTIQGGSLNGLGLGFGVRYLGSNFGDNLNTIEAPSVTLADAAIHYDWNKFRFAVNAKNVFGKEHVATCFVRGVSFCTFGETRTVTVSIGYGW